jgi:dipeptidyl aminopeptidase/acylaminoacyl peptidase
MPAASASAGDTLPQLTPAADGTARSGESLTLSNQQTDLDSPSQPEASGEGSPDPITPILTPEGTIAFSFFNPAPDRRVYEIHLIEADGANHRLFPLDGVSEPALLSTGDSHQLAFRAWSQPTSPRSLLSSNLEGETPTLIGGFFEDAQPDWSPTEYRLICASQRESDRRWRLYTIWGDGSAEKELRREGKSPSFAPDGHQFVFEGCDNTGNQCGLWLGNLDDSEYGSIPLLTDPLAKSPDWSPLGDRIVYMAASDNNWDLYLIDSDGRGTPRRLTFNSAIDGLPAWSPDGAWLAFLSRRGGNWGIWLLHVDSGHLRQIFEFDGGIFTPPVGEPYGQRSWEDEQLSWSR